MRNVLVAVVLMVPALAGAAKAYADSVVASPAVAAWIEQALREKTFVEVDEPYRQSRS